MSTHLNHTLKSSPTRRTLLIIGGLLSCGQIALGLSLILDTALPTQSSSVSNPVVLQDDSIPSQNDLAWIRKPINEEQQEHKKNL